MLTRVRFLCAERDLLVVVVVCLVCVCVCVCVSVCVCVCARAPARVPARCVCVPRFVLVWGGGASIGTYICKRSGNNTLLIQWGCIYTHVTRKIHITATASHSINAWTRGETTAHPHTLTEWNPQLSLLFAERAELGRTSPRLILPCL